VGVGVWLFLYFECCWFDGLSMLSDTVLIHVIAWMGGAEAGT